MTEPELPKRWKATHIVMHTDGPELQVMLIVASGAAYTRTEWAVKRWSRHYTGLRCVGGQWFFLRDPFKGKVRVT